MAAHYDSLDYVFLVFLFGPPSSNDCLELQIWLTFVLIYFLLYELMISTISLYRMLSSLEFKLLKFKIYSKGKLKFEWSGNIGFIEYLIGLNCSCVVL